MKRVYHANAKTTLQIRLEINKSNLKNRQLANKFGISEVTVSKWKNRKSFEDRSSRPHTIHYALSNIEEALALSIRKSTWLALDEVWKMLTSVNPNISRSSIYRSFRRNGINKPPEKQMEKSKKFKEYEPGFIHIIDVTCLPKFQGVKYYHFVAIDRATRTMYYKIYDAKTSKNEEDFMKKCLDFFPFKITHVLTRKFLKKIHCSLEI